MVKTSYQRKWERIDRILELLRYKPCTANELHKALKQEPDSENLTRRVVNKYIYQLVLDGKIEPSGNKRTAAYCIANTALEPVGALVLHSALRMLYHHTPGYNGLYFSVLNRLAEQLPPPAQDVAKASTLALKERRKNLLDEGDALKALAEGWFTGRRVKFKYKKPGGSGNWRDNLLEVYFIEVNRTNLGLYVIGKECSYHNAVRTYKINRIRNIELTDNPYTIDPAFDPQDFLFNAWGVMGKNSSGGLIRIRLRFMPEAVPWVEENGHPGIRERLYNPDRSLEVCLEVGCDEQHFPREVFSWIQGWGSRVEVLEPENLKQKWLEEARMVAALAAP